jgi:hypothetical protein
VTQVKNAQIWELFKKIHADFLDLIVSQIKCMDIFTLVTRQDLASFQEFDGIARQVNYIGHVIVVK